MKSFTEKGHPSLILGVTGLAVAIPSIRCAFQLFPIHRLFHVHGDNDGNTDDYDAIEIFSRALLHSSLGNMMSFNRDDPRLIR